MAFSAGLRVQIEWVVMGNLSRRGNKMTFLCEEQRTKGLLAVLQWHSKLNYMELLTHDHLGSYWSQFHMVKLDTFWDFASDHGKTFACSIVVYLRSPRPWWTSQMLLVLNSVKSLKCFSYFSLKLNLQVSGLQTWPLHDGSRLYRVVDKALDFLMSIGRIVDRKWRLQEVLDKNELLAIEGCYWELARQTCCDSQHPW